MSRKPKGLSLAVEKKDTDESAADGSDDVASGMAGLTIGSEKFEGNGITVDKSGVKLTDHDKVQGAVSFEDIEIVKKLGAGCSSVVQLARHKKSGELYALKLINLYEKSVRDMLLSELKALFTADCEALIEFHGATYRCVPSV